MHESKYLIKQGIKPSVAPLAAAVALGLGSTGVQSATITVTTLADGSVPGQCTLRDAIQAANTDTVVAGCSAGAGPDEIVFSPGLTGTITLTEGMLTVVAPATITGPGAELLTIDGNASNRHFATNSMLSLSNLRLANGYTNDSFYGGSAIIAQGALLELDNCVIESNVSGDVAYGGAITAMNSLVEIGSCRFEGNQTQTASRGGFPPAMGAAILAANSGVTIYESDFVNNQSDFFGGAVAAMGGSIVTIAESLFSGNSAYLGGAITAIQGATINLYDSLVSGNQAVVGGGLLVSDNAAAYLVNTAVRGNMAIGGGGMTIGLGYGSTDPKPLGHWMSELERGGGLPIQGPGNLSMTGGDVRDNTAYIFGGGVLSKYESQTSFESVSIRGNSASSLEEEPLARIGSGSLADHIPLGKGSGIPPGAGGGMALIGGSENYLIDVVLRDNVAPQGGGLMVANQAIAALGNSTVTDNQAIYGGGLQAGYIEQFIVVEAPPPDRGGISYDAAVITIDSIISGNHAVIGAGQFLVDGGVGLSKYTTVNGNTAVYHGGGIATYAATLSFKYGEVSNNSATQGGGLSGIVCNASIGGSTIANNSASFIAGGAMLNGCVSSLSHSLIAGNTAAAYIGGLMLTGAPTVSNTTVTNNSAPFVGGLFANGLDAEFLTVSHNQATALPVTGAVPDGLGIRGGPEANPGGALIRAEGLDVAIDSSLFANNIGPDNDLFITVEAPAVATLDYSLIQVPGSPLPVGTGNLTGQDPLLGPLTNNGGRTLTRALLAGSPAINAGNPVTEVEFDQRLAPWPRVFDGRADIGAFEFAIDGIFHDRFEQ